MVEAGRSPGNYGQSQRMIEELASKIRSAGLFEVITPPDTRFQSQLDSIIKGKFNELFGLKVWLRTAELTLKDLSSLRRKQIGDAFQMPGVFLLSNGEILEQYVHARASDRPDYQQLSACCVT